MEKTIAALAVVASFTIPSIAQAEDELIYGGATISTVGSGFYGGVKINDFIGIRGDLLGLAADLSWAHPDFDGRGAGEYEAEVEYDSVGVTLDLFPFNTGFHISAGFRHVGPEFEIEKRHRDGSSFGNNTYSAAEVGVARGKVNFDNPGLFIGTGWRSNIIGGFFLGTEIGGVYLGEADVTITTSGNRNDAQMQNDRQAEARDIREDVSERAWYPVLSLSLGLRF